MVFDPRIQTKRIWLPLDHFAGLVRISRSISNKIFLDYNFVQYDSFMIASYKINNGIYNVVERNGTDLKRSAESYSQQKSKVLSAL